MQADAVDNDPREIRRYILRDVRKVGRGVRFSRIFGPNTGFSYATRQSGQPTRSKRFPIGAGGIERAGVAT